MDTPPNITDEITAEIAKAIEKLGGNPETLNLTDTWAVNRTLEFLGADIYLLCAVGSWKNTMSDEEVLADLKTWHQSGIQTLRGTSFVR